MENVRKYAKIVGAVVGTIAVVGILTNLKDIKRYVRISMM